MEKLKIFQVARKVMNLGKGGEGKGWREGKGGDGIGWREGKEEVERTGAKRTTSLNIFDNLQNGQFFCQIVSKYLYKNTFLQVFWTKSY